MLPSTHITRRSAIASTVAAISGTMISEGKAVTKFDNLPWIDAHSHIWPSEDAAYPLQAGIDVADLAPASFTDQELLALARPEGVGRVVLIQHNVFHGTDNSYLTDAWSRRPDTFRVVGMIDDLRPKCDLAMLQLLKRGVTGFRIKPRPGITDWLNTDGMRQMWKTAIETRQSMCCLINPRDLPAVTAACTRSPDTPVVIDHCARIGIDGIIRETDLKKLCHLSQFPGVRVKISAYYALGHKRPPHIELLPMIRRLYEAFGSERLMWASDCPYQLNNGNSYASSIALVRDIIDFVSETERRNLLCNTAEATFFDV